MGVYNHSDMNEFEDIRTRAEAGDAEAQCQLGWLYAHGGRNNNNEAVRWYRLAAEQGHIVAQHSGG